MIPLDEAQRVVLDGCAVLQPVEMAIGEVAGCVLAEAVESRDEIPPFDNTAMDGFAVRAADTAGPPVTLRVVDTLPAGRAPDRSVGPGEAIRIMTGAPLPPGADAVVMVERTEPVTATSTDGSPEVDEVRVLAEVPAGNHVRWAGDDVHIGDAVMAPGDVLSAAHVGLLATLGVEAVRVHPRARVGVFSTGDELVGGSEPLEPGQIRDSNRAALLAAVAEAGAVPVDLGLHADDEEAIATAIRNGVAACDALITSGGVSMGDYDYVKVVLDRLGDMRWMQVAIKPAKPLAFGVVEGTPVFGLPGNPVSSLVSFELFARPGLRAMMGHTELHRHPIAAIADADLRRRPDGKTHFQRVVARVGDDGRHHVVSAGGQGSHQLSALAAANALAVLPDGDTLGAGSTVSILLLDQYA